MVDTMARQLTLSERNAMVHLNHDDVSLVDGAMYIERFKCRLCMNGLSECLCFGELKHCSPCQQCFRLTYTGSNEQIRRSLGYHIIPDNVSDLSADQDVDEVDGGCCRFCREFGSDCFCMEFVVDGNGCYGCSRATLPIEPIRQGYVPQELLVSFGYGVYVVMGDEVLFYSDTGLDSLNLYQTISITCPTCYQTYLTTNV